MVKRLDPVASRLAASGKAEASLVLDWLEGRQQRNALHRRAFWCSFSAWMLVTTAAVVGSAAAIKFAHDAREAFTVLKIDQDAWNYQYTVKTPPMTLDIIPPVLGVIAAILLVGGLVAWLCGRFPGHRWTCSAIDWSNISDAMSRLLSVGCTYPEAFDAAAEVSRTAGNRTWLRNAADQIRQGVTQLSIRAGGDNDVAILAALVENADVKPSQNWRLAKEHFGEVARRRVDLLQATLPIISTLIAGLLIWVSISATLGWMWATIGAMIRRMMVF